MRIEKLKIGKKACEFVCDGDTVFIDGATTTEYMTEFLTEKKDITVITNNVALVTHLSEYNVRVICLGGEMIEPPCMLGGEDTVLAASRYHVDKMFFSTGCATVDGRIGEGARYYLLYTVMANNAREVYFLADHEKFERQMGNRRYLFDFDKVTAVISDYDFDEDIQKKYTKTKLTRKIII